MTNAARWVVLSGLFLILGCGSSNPNNDGAPGGSGGASAGTSGGGTSGGAGTTGGGGTTGASCQACVACVQSNCASSITACQTNSECGAIYDCARGCQTPVNDCVAAHQGAIVSWASVSACLNQNCLSLCMY